MIPIHRIAAAVFGWPIFLGYGLACFLGLSLVQLFSWPFSRDLGVRLGARVWGRGVYKTIPWWTLRLHDFDRVDGRPCVVVSNHASVLDVPALMHLPLTFRVVAKRSLFRLPFLGWFMSLSRQIPADADDVGASLDRCRRELESGVSVLMFPEGTRSVDGAVGRFRRGAFHLAREAGVPVLVCAVNGTRDILPKGGLVPLRFWITVNAGVVAVLEPADFDSPRAMAQAAQAAVSAAVDGWRGEPTPAP